MKNKRQTKSKSQAAVEERVVSRVSELVEDILAGSPLFLDRTVWTGEGKRPLLQVFVDSAKGVGIDDCVDVSRQLSAELDADEDLVPGAYDLQVSSPGLTRPLEGEEDFRKYVGRFIAVETSSPVVGRRSKAVGTLQGFADGQLSVALAKSKADQDEQVVTIALEDVVKARLEIQEQPADAASDRKSSQREVKA